MAWMPGVRSLPELMGRKMTRVGVDGDRVRPVRGVCLRGESRRREVLLGLLRWLSKGARGKGGCGGSGPPPRAPIPCS